MIYRREDNPLRLNHIAIFRRFMRAHGIASCLIQVRAGRLWRDIGYASYSIHDNEGQGINRYDELSNCKWFKPKHYLVRASPSLNDTSKVEVESGYFEASSIDTLIEMVRDQFMIEPALMSNRGKGNDRSIHAMTFCIFAGSENVTASIHKQSKDRRIEWEVPNNEFFDPPKIDVPFGTKQVRFGDASLMDLDSDGYISGIAAAWDTEKGFCSLDSKFGLISSPDYPGWFDYPMASNPRMASLGNRPEVEEYLDAGFGNDLDLVTGYTLLDYLLLGSKVNQATLVMERCEESIAAPEIQKKLWDHFLPGCYNIYQNYNLKSMQPYVEEILYRLLRHESGNLNFDLACQHLLKVDVPNFRDYFIQRAQAAHARVAGEAHTTPADIRPIKMRM